MKNGFILKPKTKNIKKNKINYMKIQLNEDQQMETLIDFQMLKKKKPREHLKKKNEFPIAM